MKKYFTQQEAKELDKKLLEDGCSLTTLIEVAGFAGFEVVNYLIGKSKQKIGVFIGPGNNGADGLVISKYLLFSGHKVTIFLNKTNRLEMLDICLKNGAELAKIEDDSSLNGTDEIKDYDDIKKFDFVIDSIFGFSFVNTINKPYDKIIEAFKSHPKIISIDVPSGYALDSEENDGMFVPFAVVALTAPKICCKKLNTYLARAFLKGGWENFDGFIKID
ncbi:hypothetical protein TUBRATIS_19790 [Tubulinosema ratisbonensis]|uniref:NAD(P)H-hydrate epimerase n=1 Tax=Tubulinosema ratisbonensis TaxID=291195 RepID=A0A437AKE5_9MICR|nr:hypothetical protein TUBRATIS_19790 [Tubulinosema ratisbonensis]